MREWFGVFAGVVAGVLLAPASGEETRKKLKKASEDKSHLISNSKEKTEEMITKTLDAIEKGFSNIKMVDKNQNHLKHPELSRD